MNPQLEFDREMTRRQLLSTGRSGLGAAALASLLGAESTVQAESQSKKITKELPHFAPKAKRVIYLFMAGGPSHIDMFDYKPAMRDFHGSELPESIRQGQRLTGIKFCRTPQLSLTTLQLFVRCTQRRSITTLRLLTLTQEPSS